MLSTRNLTCLDLHKIADVPMCYLVGEQASDVFKAARVLERRQKEWLAKNPDKTVEDWRDEWYPGGNQAYTKKLFSAYVKALA